MIELPLFSPLTSTFMALDFNGGSIRRATALGDSYDRVVKLIGSQSRNIYLPHRVFQAFVTKTSHSSSLDPPPNSSLVPNLPFHLLVFRLPLYINPYFG